MKKLYLDDSATSQVTKKVADAIYETLTKDYGNPSSLHEKGEEAHKILTKSREILAKEINAKPWELVFTSGGTEADNLAIQGLAKANPQKKKIIISTIEHAAILETCNYLKTQNYKIVKIPVDKGGLINLSKLQKEIDSDTLLVSIIHANNIIGTVQNLKAIRDLCKKHKVPFHTDASQSFGKIKIDVKKQNISLLTASAHKIGGPKGTGFLYIDPKIKLVPILYGGGQERNLRSGTENLPGIVGFAEALKLSKKTNKTKIHTLQKKLIKQLQDIGGTINGSTQHRLHNNIHVSFNKIESDALVISLSQKGIYVSSGSACDSKKQKEDHVLKALGISQRRTGSIRITLNSQTTESDIKHLIKNLKQIIEKSTI